MKRIITTKVLERFKHALYEEEKSEATIKKYITDIKKLADFLSGEQVSKENMIRYKEYLQDCGKFKISSINSFLAAANHFCEVLHWEDARIKTLRMQREVFRLDERFLSMEEYESLVRTAMNMGKEKLCLIIQTIASTGIRISELRYITVSAVNCGMAEINCKGKIRRILLPEKLQRILGSYIKKRGIKEGMIFRTSGNKAMDRSNVWKEMKVLCEKAGLDKRKVFPHNLRHLFARVFYEMKKDIIKLADILGHSNIETTRIYMRSTGTEHRKQLNAMEMVVVMMGTT